MIWCIIATTLLGVIFKLYAAWKVNPLNAIVINYCVCLVLGTWLDPELRYPFEGWVLEKAWLPFDIALGFIFIIGFNMMAHAVRHSGIALATMMMKMSIVLTVAYAVIVFHEVMDWPKSIGLLMAVGAIIMMNQKSARLTLGIRDWFSSWLMYVLIFSAAIEIILYYVDRKEIVGDHQLAFTTHGFGCAAIIGWLVVGWQYLTRRKAISWRDVGGGILLGFPNYFSIYLVLALLKDGSQGSTLYPILNVSVVLLSTAVGVFVFKEKLSRLNWWGMVLAGLSIALISISQNQVVWQISF